MTSVTGGCISQVLKQSDPEGDLELNDTDYPESMPAWAACAALSCASNELPIIKAFGSSECECVPDVFEYPQNPNQSGDRFGAALAVGDFDADGFEDLIAGAPGEAGSSGESVGVVYVFRGSAAGLRYWKRIAQSHTTVVNPAVSSTPFGPTNTAGDEFGSSLAAGDFDADGFADAAIGAPGKNSDAGVVYLFPGGASGLDFSNGQELDQRLTSTSTAREAGDRFGAALTVGRFDEDSIDDLAVAAPFETVNGETCGAVSVHRGTNQLGATGLVIGDALLTQDLTTFSADEDGDEFGFAMSAGNVSSAGARDELVVGSPGEDSDRGMVFVWRRGLTGTWISTDAFQPTTTSGRFGAAIVTGDFVDSAPGIDIAVGSPNQASGAGAVSIWDYTGTTSVLVQTIVSNETDHFGTALARGDLVARSPAPNPAVDDLVVGSPDEEFGTGPKEGRILVYAHGSSGMTHASNVTQADLFGIAGATVGGESDTSILPEGVADDDFGSAIAVGSFGSTVGSQPFHGIVVGAPRDESPNAVSAGALFTVRPGTLKIGRRIDQHTMRYGAVAPPY